MQKDWFEEALKTFVFSNVDQKAYCQVYYFNMFDYQKL